MPVVVAEEVAVVVADVVGVVDGVVVGVVREQEPTPNVPSTFDVTTPLIRSSVTAVQSATFVWATRPPSPHVMLGICVSREYLQARVDRGVVDSVRE